MITQEDKTSSLPNLNYKQARHLSSIDLSILQKSKTIQSDMDLLHRVKQSLESSSFNNFFASSLAKLPSYKNPQELAKALAEQFIQKELSIVNQARPAKSATRTQQFNFQNETLPLIKPQTSSKLEKGKQKVRSKSRDQQLDKIHEQNENSEELIKKVQKQRIKLKEKVQLREQERERILKENREKEREKERLLREKEKSYMIDQTPEKKVHSNRPLRYTISSIKQPPSPIQEPQYLYSYFLGFGNNHELVKRILDTRPDWHQTNNTNRSNFRWQQSYNGYKYFKLNQHKSHREVVNHFEFHPEISNKKNLLLNIIQFCEQTNQNPFTILPITFILDFNDQTIESQLYTFYQFFNRNAPENKQLNKNDFQNKLSEIKKKLRLPPGKDRKILDFNMIETFIGPEYLWLLKPTGLNRGRGIHVIQEIDNLVELLIDYQYGYTEKVVENSKDENGNNQQKISQYMIKCQSFVVQKYIEKPLLINDRKFDIRVWVLVTNDLQCYFFREGYIRMASEIYNTGDTKNLYIHLTNNAIQKYSEKYGEQEDGNQLSFDQVQQYLKQKIDFRQILVEQMKKLSFLALNSVANKINKLNRKFCIEIFGFDYFIDDLFNLYLIEVNTNPCLEESSPLLQMLLPRMLDDAFKLTLDSFFPLQKEREIKSFPVTNYDDDYNMWQLLGDLQAPQNYQQQE